MPRNLRTFFATCALVAASLAGMALAQDDVVNVYTARHYVSDEDLNLTLLYGPDVMQCEGCNNAVGSQGIGIDWSRDDTGYHTAAGQGEFPEFYGTLNTFALDGSAYVWGSEFGPVLGDGPLFPPQVQGGDVTAMPDITTTPGDLDGDDVVGVSDLLILLGAWGACDNPDDCPADFDEDGTVGVSDLLTLLGNWE